MTVITLMLLSKKGVSPYEYMDDWKQFNETTLPEKEKFHDNVTIEDTKEVDYNHEKRGCKDFEIKSLGEYDDFYLRSDVLLTSNIFKNL